MKKTIAFLLCLMLFASCALADTVETQATDYDTLIVGSTTAMTGRFFTEMFGSNTADLDVELLLHGYNLVKWQDAMGAFAIDPTVVSGLAAMEDPEGNRTYVFTLYDDLTYSDGSPITAWDYAFSFLLSCSPVMAQIGAQAHGGCIVGSDAYFAGEADALSGVRVVNDTTLNITVKAEYANYYYQLAFLRCNPYPINVLAPGCVVVDTEEGVAIRNADTTLEEPLFTADLLTETVLDAETGYLTHPSVVSGPYTLTSYDAAARKATFSVNPYFKGNEMGVTPSIPNVIFCHVENETMMDELANGNVHLLNKCVNAESIAKGMALMAENDQYAVANYPRSGLGYISFCCEKAAVADVAVRQALALCLDKDAAIQDYVSNFGLAVDGYYGLGQWIYQVISGVLTPVNEDGEAADETVMTEEETAAWAELTLENVPVYRFDPAAAAALLADNGWTANEEGVLAKEVEGEQITLDLKLVYPEGNAIGDSLRTNFVEHLAEIGVKLTVEAAPFEDLLQRYYDTGERDCDMLFLASNFDVCFDPTETYRIGGSANRSHIADEKLAELAADLDMTEPGDLLTYCQKWVAFQEYWAEALPAIPVYSNVYFDFYTGTLHDYAVNGSASWAEAIIGAYRGDIVVEAPEDLDGEMFEGDEDLVEIP